MIDTLLKLKKIFKSMPKRRVVRLILGLSCIILLIFGVIFGIKKGWLFRAEEIMPEEATINIDVGSITGDLNSNIFGVGMSGKTQGLFESGFTTAIENMGVKLIRIHADAYIGAEVGFLGGLGPSAERYNPSLPGPDEWGHLARTSQTEAVIAIPFIDGSEANLRQAKNLVEYMNTFLDSEINQRAIDEGWQMNLTNPDGLHSWGGKDTAPEGYFAWLRKQVNNGNDPGPYYVKYWEIGNEVYGSWYPNRWPVEDYSSKAINWATEMKKVDSSIKIGIVVTDDWEESVWDKGNLPPKIWNEIIINKVIDDAKTKKSAGELPAIDFLIPHYYHPSLIGSAEDQTYMLFNPRVINYKFSDTGQESQVKLSHTRKVTLGPGTYTFSIEGRGVAADGLYPELQLRIIDDGGSLDFLKDLNQPVEIPSGAVYDAGKLTLGNETLQKYEFPNPIVLTEPKDYRLELLLNNHIWRNSPHQDKNVVKSANSLQNASDYFAQSFLSNETTNNIDVLKTCLMRTHEIDTDKKILAEIYPDAGGQPDRDPGEMVAKFGFESWDNLYNRLAESPNISCFNLKKIEENGQLVEGGKYWIVIHLVDSAGNPADLSTGAVYTRGNNLDEYPEGSFQFSANGSSWNNDGQVSDMYFYVHKEVQRVVYAKKVAADNNGNSQIISLDEKDWFEGVALDAFYAQESMTKIKDYLDSLKSQNSLSDYALQIMPTEWSNRLTGEGEPNRQLYTAIYDANTFVNYINNGIDGAMAWSTSASENRYRYQDPWSLFFINDGPSPDNPDLYLYTPRYYLFKLLSENRGNKLVTTNIESPDYEYNINFAWDMMPKEFYLNSNPNLVKPPLYQRPFLNGYTSYDTGQKKLYLTVVNSNAEAGIAADIDINGFMPLAVAKVKVLNTASDKGMLSMNGFVTRLVSVVEAGVNQISVQDASRFNNGDLISLQETSQGYSEYFKISSIGREPNSTSGTIHLSDLAGGQGVTAKRYSESSTDVVRVTNDVGINSSQLNYASQNFSYTFPAHSVTVLELTASTVLAPTSSATYRSMPNPSPTPTPTLTPAPTPAPSPTEELVQPHSNVDNLAQTIPTSYPTVTPTPSPAPADSSSPSSIASPTTAPQKSAAPEEEKTKGLKTLSRSPWIILIVILGSVVLFNLYLWIRDKAKKSRLK